MAASEENSALFPIFILTIMALPLVPYTILKLCRAASKKIKSIHCQCSECAHSGKYRKSIFKRVSSIDLEYALIFDQPISFTSAMCLIFFGPRSQTSRPAVT